MQLPPTTIKDYIYIHINSPHPSPPFCSSAQTSTNSLHKMSPQKWAQHSCSWTRQGSTHLFVFRVVDWSCGMKNCLLCVVKYLTDILQRSSRALEKKKKKRHTTVQWTYNLFFFLKNCINTVSIFNRSILLSLFANFLKAFSHLTFFYFYC